MFTKLTANKGNYNDAFSTLNPVVGFSYFISVILFSMFFTHPYYIAANVFFAFVYYFSLAGMKTLRFLLVMTLVFTALTLINPIFNTYGATVLFRYWNGRPYTLEAVFYGMVTAGMFTGMIAWFASYNAIMTSEKFIYLFGRMIPSLSLLFSMILRLIPNLQTRIVLIRAARKCIGKDPGQGTKRRQLENAASLLSVLTGRELEAAVITADSMRSRGYGLKYRTAYAIYRFGLRDKLLLIFMVILFTSVLVTALKGTAKVIFIPYIMIPAMNVTGILCIVSYVMLLIIPPAMNIMEAIKWNVLRSKI